MSRKTVFPKNHFLHKTNKIVQLLRIIVIALGDNAIIQKTQVHAGIELTFDLSMLRVVSLASVNALSCKSPTRLVETRRRASWRYIPIGCPGQRKGRRRRKRPWILPCTPRCLIKRGKTKKKIDFFFLVVRAPCTETSHDDVSTFLFVVLWYNVVSIQQWKTLRGSIRKKIGCYIFKKKKNSVFYITFFGIRS